MKLAAMLGAFTDPARVLVGAFLGVVAGGLVGLGLLATGRKRRKDAIPFGPFLAAGGFAGAEWRRQVLACTWGSSAEAFLVPVPGTRSDSRSSESASTPRRRGTVEMSSRKPARAAVRLSE